MEQTVLSKRTSGIFLRRFRVVMAQAVVEALKHSLARNLEGRKIKILYPLNSAQTKELTTKQAW